MRECSKNLRPDDAKVADTTEIDVCKGAVEDVTEQMAEEPEDDSFAATVATESRGSALRV
jgi:hypothetical protein